MRDGMDKAEAFAALDGRACGAKRFLDKVCVVTGAGQGIGRAVAKRLAAEGARLVIGELMQATGQETLDMLRAHGVDAHLVVGDISHNAEAEKLMRRTKEIFGRIDVLVNVVGGTIWWKPYDQYTEEEIRLELDRSLYTTLWCCHAVLPHMIEQHSGAIVNISSSVTRGGLFRGPYAASKGAVDALTRTLAAENGEHGIRVNAVAPGSTRSDIG